MEDSLKSVRLFSSKIEIINLMLPVVLLLALGATFIFNMNIAHSFSRREISYLSNILFLNITHNAFTFVLLTSALPMQRWIREGQGEGFWTKQAFIGGLLSAFFFLLLYWSPQHKWLFLVFTLINFNFAAHHALSQVFGLSLAYSGKLPLKRKIFGGQGQERFIFNLFLFSNLLAGSVFIISAFGQRIIGLDDIPLFIQSIMYWIFCLEMLLVLLPLYLYGAKSALRVVVFNVRYLFWPLTLISHFAVFITMALHGLEYAFVTHKMFRGHSLQRPFLAFGLVFLVVILAVVRINSLGPVSIGVSPPLWFLLLSGLSIGISFHHYYLDRQIFRMRHQLNREIVGPMLFGQEKEGQV